MPARSSARRPFTWSRSFTPRREDSRAERGPDRGRRRPSARRGCPSCERASRCRDPGCRAPTMNGWIARPPFSSSRAYDDEDLGVGRATGTLGLTGRSVHLRALRRGLRPSTPGSRRTAAARSSRSSSSAAPRVSTPRSPFARWGIHASPTGAVLPRSGPRSAPRIFSAAG